MQKRKASGVKTKALDRDGQLVGVIVIVLALLPLAIAGSYYMHILILAFVYVVVSSGFRTISISGQFNIAQGAFMGIGAYAAAMPSVWLHWPPWVTIPLGAVAATIIGSSSPTPSRVCGPSTTPWARSFWATWS